MIKKSKKNNSTSKLIELIQDLLIIELGKKKIPQREIRKIVGVDIHKVNRIVKHFKK